MGIVVGGGSGHEPTFFGYVGAGSELLEERGIRTLHFAVTDDVASAPADERAQRRGVAGDVFVLKAAVACAGEGASPEEVHHAARHANDRTGRQGSGSARAGACRGTSDLRAAGGLSYPSFRWRRSVRRG